MLCDLCGEEILLGERAAISGMDMHQECALREAMGGIGHLIDHDHFCYRLHGEHAVNKPRRVGTAHESHIVTWLKANGWPYARRIILKGARDEGDVNLGDGIPVTVEAKAEKTITLSQYLKELDAEIVNAGAETGVVIIKRRGTTDVGQYYALTTVAQWNALARAVYRPKRKRIVAIREE